MSRWWRAYDDAVDDEKLLLLSDKLHRSWFNLLCLASKNNGRLPAMEVMCLKLRMSQAKVVAIIEELKERKLLDERDDGIEPHNWNGRQYKSDISTERVKRFRNAKRTVSETHQSTETETEKIKRADARGGYAFIGSIIKLNQKHFDNWTQCFPNLDLRGELTARDAWLAGRATDNDRESWFISTSKYLANRNLEAKSKIAAARPGKTMSGMEGVS